MGGGLLQLVALGAQDAYISGNPQITFWKGLFKRHTNFAMEPFRINFTGQPNWGTKQSATINRNADLLYSTYLEVHLPHYDTSSTTRKSAVYNNDQFALGYNLLKYVELEIGGQLIDRQYGEWLFLWDTLTGSTEQSVMLHKLNGAAGRPQVTSAYVSGQSSAYNIVGPATATGTATTEKQGAVDVVTLGTQIGTSANLGYYVSGQGTASAGQVFIPGVPAGCSNTGQNQNQPGLPTVVYVPLKFFYTRNPGAALPLIALQYHEVKINILWNDNQTISGDYNHVPVPAQPSQAAIYVDYIYLDVEERRRMAQESHEYLIEQVQYNEDKGLSSYQNRIDLTFNHPVKELVWVVQPTCYRSCKVPIPGQSGNPYAQYNTMSRGARYQQTSFDPSHASNSSIIGPAGTGAPAYQNTDGSTNRQAQNVNRLTPFTYDQTAVYKQWLQINGQDRLDARYGDYFNKVQPYQHHTGSTNTSYNLQYATPTTVASATLTTSASSMAFQSVGQTRQPGIYSYSFALKPEEHQPSGTCNFSRIDTATLVLQLSGDCVVNQGNDATWDVRVYALNYNILRIMSGMAGLAYSN
jgi:hypothetical protein